MAPSSAPRESSISAVYPQMLAPDNPCPPLKFPKSRGLTTPHFPDLPTNGGQRASNEGAGSEAEFPNHLPNSFQNRNDSSVKSVLNNLGQAGRRRKWKTSFATGQWSLYAVRARCFVPWRAGDCLLKQRCGTTKRWKKSQPARSNAMITRRLVHSLMRRRFAMRAMEVDCRRFETFTKAIELTKAVDLTAGSP
jgi:hypothetical protein